eukprot:gene3908-7795_t
MSTRFTINTKDAIALKGKLWKASPDCDLSLPVIIFVHQLGKLGGSQALMSGMASRMAGKGYDAMTFNLRGIGGSSGYASWSCKAEQTDLKAIIEYAQSSCDKDIILVGSSAGAPLAGALLDYSPRIKGGMFIGYVWGFWASILFGWAYTPIKISTKPKIFVIGDRDEFTTLAQYKVKMSELQGPINIAKVIEGKNHFEIESPLYDDMVTDWLDDFIRTNVITQVH